MAGSRWYGPTRPRDEHVLSFWRLVRHTDTDPSPRSLKSASGTQPLPVALIAVGSVWAKTMYRRTHLGYRRG